MDIRVAAYRPVTVTTFQRPGNPVGVATVQNAANSGPVQPVGAIRQTQANMAFAENLFATTETRGTRVNILA